MALNIYPLILTGLHRLGLDWELAAGLWGVTVSSLVVLPLWGWVRRQFDDRVALVACLLYAVNPKFIEWSPEVMRDPTFWLLFMLAIYWLWRAVTEVRYGYFIAAGTAIMLASLTRIEGLFLLIPLTLWTFWRFVALRTDRKKLLLGAVLCVVVFPALLAAVNIGWVCGHSGWAALRLSPLARVEPWLASILGHAPADVDAEGLEKPLGFGRMIWIFIPTMTRGLSPVFALLMFGGIWGWRRVWARRDHQPLFYTAVVIMCGIWVQLWYDRNICPRYALPIVLMASPFAALGLLGLIARLLRIAGVAAMGHPAAAGRGCGRGGDCRDDQPLRRHDQQRQVLRNAANGRRPRLLGAQRVSARRRRSSARWASRRSSVSTPITHPTGRSAGKPTTTSILAMIDQSRASVVLLQPAKELTERAMRRLGGPAERGRARAGRSQRPARNLRRAFRSGACEAKPAHRAGTVAGILRDAVPREKASLLSPWESG